MISRRGNQFILDLIIILNIFKIYEFFMMLEKEF